MKILYASQTGNSADVAERIWRKLKYQGISTNLYNICDYKISNLINEHIVIFVCSTTGQGECPDDMQYFWKFLLRKSLPSDSLCSLKFGVIGLGDSSYAKYNFVAKKLSKRLMQLGAHPCFPVVLCDDQHELGYDAAFEPWLKHFVETILPSLYPKRHVAILDESDLLPPKYKVHFVSKNQNALVEKNEVIESEFNPCYFAKVKSNSRITAEDHFQAVHLIKFVIGEEVSYKPGDVAIFMPQNDPENVENFAKLLSGPLDEEFILCPTDPNTALPKHLQRPFTIRHCISSFWDIQGIPRRTFFDILWHFSKSDLEQEKLKEFTTAEGQEDLYSYCNRPRRNILEVLQDFPNTTPYIPVDYLFDLIPCIRPRSFSIASSISYHPRELHILVAVVKYKTQLLKPRQGLCSTWLSKLDPHSEMCIPFSLKHGSVSLPPNSAPVILVGPGTGCAPFRGFIQERSVLGVKENYLFFGCRYNKKDFLCKDEWLAFVREGTLHLYTAFSRDQEHKIYVQHRILENSVLLWNLIYNYNAYVYIAGNSKNMPDDVKKAFLHIISEEGNLDPPNAEMFLEKLLSEQKLMIETWS